MLQLNRHDVKLVNMKKKKIKKKMLKRVNKATKEKKLEKTQTD